MSLQIRRGLEANRTFVADEGEPLWVTDTDRLFIGDGVTSGGKAVKALAVGTASGDLSGSFPGPTVAKLQGNTVQSGTPADGDSLIYETANTRWARKPAGIAGVTVQSGTPSDNESLVYDSSAGQWAHKHPVLSSAQSFIGADVTLTTASTDYDIASVSLVAGTWSIHAAATMSNAAGGSALLTIEIYNDTGAATLASASQSCAAQTLTVCNTSCSSVVTLNATSTIKLRARSSAASKTIAYQAYPTTKINATGISAVRLA